MVLPCPIVYSADVWRFLHGRFEVRSGHSSTPRLSRIHEGFAMQTPEMDQLNLSLDQFSPFDPFHLLLLSTLPPFSLIPLDCYDVVPSGGCYNAQGKL